MMFDDPKESKVQPSGDMLMRNFLILAVGLLIIGSIFASVSGLTMRPDTTDANYSEQMEAKNSKGRMFYMIGMTFADAGLLTLSAGMFAAVISSNKTFLVRVAASLGGTSFLLTAIIVLVTGPLVRFTTGA